MIALDTLNLTPEFVASFRVLGKQVGYRNLGRAIAYSRPDVSGDLLTTPSIAPNGNGHKPGQTILAGDIPPLAEINKRIGQLAKGQKMTTRQQKEWYQLLAQKDIHNLLATGDADEQMDNLDADITEMQQDLELRAVRQEYRPKQAPQFGTREREEWKLDRAGRPHGQRPTTSYSNEPIEAVRGRLAVFAAFRDGMSVDIV